MSNKKQSQYIVKSASTESAASSAPPRYQPPPQPPAPAGGILKHQQHPLAKDAGKPGYANPKPAPPDHAKYYPVPPQHLSHPPPPQQQPPPAAKPYLGYPAYPQRAAGPGAGALHRRYEDELLRAPPVDMLKFVRKADAEGPRVSAAAVADRHVQGLVAELRLLKEANQRLADDNQELRDLCCFLDDDRQKGRKLAREWQRFGRYTASVMRQEVSAYQSKLRELDNKQQELIKDNLELKELCLYLDEERAGSGMCAACGAGTGPGSAGAATTGANGALRDDGDGSSSSTNADEPGQFGGGVPSAPPPRRSASRERLLHENLARQRSTFNDQTMQYVRSLEQRVKQLEDEKRSLQHKVNQLAPGSGGGVGLPLSLPEPEPLLSGRPEAVVRALQVLEVREQLEREGRAPALGPPPAERPDTAVPGPGAGDDTGPPSPDMDDGEKALVREMCNVVWRKLEEGPQARR